MGFGRISKMKAVARRNSPEGGEIDSDVRVEDLKETLRPALICFS